MLCWRQVRPLLFACCNWCATSLAFLGSGARRLMEVPDPVRHAQCFVMCLPSWNVQLQAGDALALVSSPSGSLCAAPGQCLHSWVTPCLLFPLAHRPTGAVSIRRAMVSRLQFSKVLLLASNDARDVFLVVWDTALEVSHPLSDTMCYCCMSVSLHLVLHS